ncbi:MAG: metal-sulfur cluster assembly factor [Acidimicrobiia bacterium]
MSDSRTYLIGSAQQSPEEKASRALSAVIDPELGLDIVQLGLVYSIEALDNVLHVEMTLTTPGCPVSESLPQEARTVLVEALPEFEIDLQIVWDPPWTPDMLTPAAMDLLGFRPR